MSKSSSRYSRDYQLPAIGKSPMRGVRKVSPIKLRMQADKCPDCGTEEQATVCLTCLKIKCVSCGLAHSKGYPNHNVTDIKEAYQKLTEKAKQLEIHIQMINKGMNHILENQNKKDTINYNLFEESMNKIKSLQEQVMNSISTYFQKITNSFITMWNNFVEIWGQGRMLSDRVNTIYLKLKSFLQQDSLDQASVLAWLFKDNVFQETQQIIESYERKEKMKVEELLSSDQLMPPSILLDLAFVNKIDQMLNSLIQLVDWQTQQPEYQIRGSIPNIIPIIPIGSQNLFLYDKSTKEYQVGDFQDIRQQQLPYFSKSILSPTTGILYIVGGSNQMGFPVRSLLSYNDGELISLAPLPKCKNPSNGLIINRDQIYVIGGMRVEDERVQWSKSCEIYFIKENKWMGLDSMEYAKPHQSVFKINNFIYAFGLQLHDFQNIERFNLDEHNWTKIALAHHSVNPFQFGGGYLSATINQNQVLLFGGKQWQRKTLEDLQNSFIEEDIMKTIYTFDIRQNCFQSLGEKMPGVGVSFGDYMPLVCEGKVITFETPISKVKKIHRWLQVLNVVEITFSAHQVEAEVVQIMNPE